MNIYRGEWGVREQVHKKKKAGKKTNPKRSLSADLSFAMKERERERVCVRNSAGMSHITGTLQMTPLVCDPHAHRLHFYFFFGCRNTSTKTRDSKQRQQAS